MFKHFHDESNANYDQAIRAARDRYNSNKECGLQEVNQLIADLHEIKDTYWPRPCFEGFCFGLFIPHRSRIQSRINKLYEDRMLLDKICHHKYGVLRKFDDESNTDYDYVFNQTRETFSSNQMLTASPFEQCSHLEKNIEHLKKLKKEYWPRLCYAGKCLGIMTPHKDRIDERIKAIQISLNSLYSIDCERFKQAEIEKNVQQKRNNEVINKLIDGGFDVLKTLSSEKK